MLIYIIILSILIILTIFLSVKYPHFIKKIDNSLLVALVIATFTLFFTPYVNKEFEKQSVYSEYILDNLKNLKLDTLAIYNEIQEISRGKNDFNRFFVLKLNIEYRVTEINLLLGETVESKMLLDTLNTLSIHIKDDDNHRFFLLKNFVNASKNMTLYLATETKIFEKKVVPLTIYSEKDIEDALKNWEKTKRTNNAQQFCTPRK